MIDSKSIRNALLVFSATVTMLIIGFNIYLVANNSSMSALENALINTLFFIASIAFSGIFTYISAENSFKQAQREFGFSAYRRIKELEQFIDLYQVALDEASLVISQTADKTLVTSKFFDLRMLSEYIKRTTISSIDDWSQIIGDDLDKISKLEEYSSQLSELELIHSKNTNNTELDDKLNKKILELQAEIKLLNEQIPQYVLRNYKKTEDEIDKIRERLSRAGMFRINMLNEAEIENYKKELSSYPYELDISLSNKHIDDFFNSEIHALFTGDKMKFDIDDRKMLFLENERGQKVRVTGTRMHPRKFVSLFDEILIENNISMSDLEATVLFWDNDTMRGKVRVEKAS